MAVMSAAYWGVCALAASCGPACLAGYLPVADALLRPGVVCGATFILMLSHRSEELIGVARLSRCSGWRA